MTLLMWMDDRLVDVRTDDFEPGTHAFLLRPAGDGEFHAACSCGWHSFGTYVSPRAPQLASMHDSHKPQGVSMKPTPEKRTGDCRVCERTQFLKEDGTVILHGIIDEGRCPGSNQPPVLVYYCRCGYMTDTQDDLDGHILGSLDDDLTKEPEHRQVDR